MLQSRNANYFNKLDFVYLSDDAIEQLFVTDRARNQLNNRILYPPLALRRTAKQIRDFYYHHGSKQCQQLIDKYANYKINARLQTIPEEEPVEAMQCSGISLSDIRAVRTTRERLAKIEEGFKDLVEESMDTCSHW